MRSSSAPLSSRPQQRGVAAVEFALLLMVMITLVAGILELGRTFWYYDAMSKATRNGARAMSVAAKATLGTVGAPAAIAQVVADVGSAGVIGFESDNVLVLCVSSTNVETACADASSPIGVRVRVTGYSMTLGKMMPFLLGAASSYDIGLAPSTTMPYMK